MIFHPPDQSSGILSEGDKRDSKGDMPETRTSPPSMPTTLSRTGMGAAAEATLLRSQRLGLGRGGSCPQLAFTDVASQVTHPV